MNVQSGALPRRRSGREISEDVADRPTLVATQSLNWKLKKALPRQPRDKSRRTNARRRALRVIGIVSSIAPRWISKSGHRRIIQIEPAQASARTDITVAISVSGYAPDAPVAGGKTILSSVRQ